jgi:hypothetical protein
VKIPDTGRNPRYQGLASVYGACAPGDFRLGIFKLGRNQGAKSAFFISEPTPQWCRRSVANAGRMPA